MNRHVFSVRPVRRLRTTVWTRLKQGLLMLYGLCVRIRVVGNSKMAFPLRRNFIVVANHLNGADSIVLQVALRTRLFFAASARWFASSFSRFIMKNICDSISVETGDAMQSLEGLRTCIHILRSGASIGIYPEGRINTSNSPGELKEGAAYLAARTGTPILPVYIRNLRLGHRVDDTTLQRECWTGFLSVVENLFNINVEVVLGDPVIPGTEPYTGDNLRQDIARINGELRRNFLALRRPYRKTPA